MRNYETVIIVYPELNEEDIESFLNKVKDQVSNLNGKLFKIEKWGTRKLAYKIRKQDKGYYIVIYYQIDTKGVQEIGRLLRLDDRVMRFQTVKTEETSSKHAKSLAEQATS